MLCNQYSKVVEWHSSSLPAGLTENCMNSCEQPHHRYAAVLIIV